MVCQGGLRAYLRQGLSIGILWSLGSFKKLTDVTKLHICRKFGDSSDNDGIELRATVRTVITFVIVHSRIASCSRRAVCQDQPKRTGCHRPNSIRGTRRQPERELDYLRIPSPLRCSLLTCRAKSGVAIKRLPPSSAAVVRMS